MKKILSILLIVTALLVTACASSNNIDKTANETVTNKSKNNSSNETIKESKSETDDNKEKTDTETSNESFSESDEIEDTTNSETLEETEVETKETKNESSSETIKETAKETQGKKDKPLIGIAWSKDFTGENYPSFSRYYIESIEKAGGKFKFLPKVTSKEEAISALKSVDGVILMGGEDIDPKYYNEDSIPQMGKINADRDTNDLSIVKAAVELDKPLFATCRGIQVLNVALGGSLYQDIPTQLPSDIVHRDPNLVEFTKHNINVVENTSLHSWIGSGEVSVNSWHHQGIKELGKDLIVTAKSSDGIVEGVRMERKKFIVGVQFHPEEHIHNGEDKFLNIYKALIDASR